MQQGQQQMTNGSRSSQNDGFLVFSNYPEYQGKPDTPSPIPCEYCGKPRYTMGYIMPDAVRWRGKPLPCDCAGATEAQRKEDAERAAAEEAQRKAEAAEEMRKRVQRIIGASGMGDRFLQRTFDTFQITDGNRQAAEIAKRYADSFDRLLPVKGAPEPGRNGLLIVGPPGTGKTHLAAAIANKLIQQGQPVICMTMIDLLARIKRTFSTADTDEDSVLRTYKTVQLLIIDDMGKEPATEWATATVYNIINGRYEAYLPTIVTTNYTMQPLIGRMTPRDTKDSTTAAATVDRLMEMCRGITLTGESWRRK